MKLAHKEFDPVFRCHCADLAAQKLSRFIIAVAQRAHDVSRHGHPPVPVIGDKVKIPIAAW